MRMQVKCGDPDCRSEFYVDSMERVWECPSCTREIENRNYPFLTAVLMQSKIDSDQTNWKAMYKKLIRSARDHIMSRNGSKSDQAFLDEAEKLLDKDLDKKVWKEEHDELIVSARKVILKLEDA